jgi:hypothetical protein
VFPPEPPLVVVVKVVEEPTNTEPGEAVGVVIVGSE